MCQEGVKVWQGADGMEASEIFDKIKEFFIEEFEIEEELITMDAGLFTDLGLDSIDALDMVGMLESNYDIEVKENEIKNIRTIRDVVEFISGKLA
jgi:acyl carrier protein